MSQLSHYFKSIKIDHNYDYSLFSKEKCIHLSCINGLSIYKDNTICGLL